MPFGFGPERRLRKHGEFVRAQRTARRVGTQHFALLVAPQPAGRAAAPPRLGLVVSRKVGSAVARNRVKRVCRECFRQWPSLLPDGVDLVVIARDGAPELGLDEVRAEWRTVERLLKKRALEALARAAEVEHRTSRAGAWTPSPPQRPGRDP